MVVTLAPSDVVPPLLVVRLVKAVDPPTTPPKVVAPDVLTVRLWAPLMVLKAMAPLPVEVRVASPVKVSASP